MRRHPVDVVSLVFGVAFLGLAGVVLAGHLTGVGVRPELAAPFLLVLIGAAGLLGSLSRLGREAGRPRDDEGRDELPYR